MVMVVEKHANLADKMANGYLHHRPDVHLHVVPLLLTKNADCNCQLLDRLGLYLAVGIQRSSRVSGFGRAQVLSFYNQNHAQVVLCCMVGAWRAEKKKVLRRGWRGEATGEATLKVVVSKPHVGGSMLMVGRSMKW